MPIYMDRHDVSEEVTAEHVARLHQADLKIQGKYNCKGLTYWFDGKRQTAFCLVEAPDKDSLKLMHDNAHGEVPHRIIEVDGAVVESFLGRIEDPEKIEDTELHIIDDPAFRTILISEIKPLSLRDFSTQAVKSKIKDFNDSIPEKIGEYDGNIVYHKFYRFLASFDSVTKAVACALEIHSGFKSMTGKAAKPALKLNIGLNAGVPVTEKEGLFEDTIRLAERLCYVHKNNITVSAEVRDLYESENLNVSVDKNLISALSSNDEDFLNLLLDQMEREWSNSTVTSEDFCKSMGYSRTQLYRKTTAVTGKSPNRFIREYRLGKALKLLDKRKDHINKIAYDSGFNSPAYFSKCFMETFGILPSS